MSAYLRKRGAVMELCIGIEMPVADAVVGAGAVRFRPMMLTAAAVIVGVGVILFDPIFQELAFPLMAGEVARCCPCE